MIRISSLKLKPGFCEEGDLMNALSKKLRLRKEDILKAEPVKISLDARDKENISWNYIVDAEICNEDRVLRSFENDRDITKADVKKYVLPAQGKTLQTLKPCIVGSGPAGLFCAYMLAREGYCPILIEQGQRVEERIKTVSEFHEKGLLNPYSNVQFGEGGAGTFSDGKLNTGIKDRSGRKRLVLETFAENGAPKEILYDSRPHIGTDILSEVIRSMREHILSFGGEILFDTRFTGFAQRDGCLVSITLENNGKTLIRPCNVLVLACGHSSRDTFCMLKGSGIKMQCKPFAVGIRAEHLQNDIDRSMYGKDFKNKYGPLPPSEYKLTYKAKDGRGVYSFCMCPGGYVVNSSSEEGYLCVNGMSLSSRDGPNANSAIVVTIDPGDLNGEDDPLKGIDFQKSLERAAFLEAQGKIPLQRLEDFIKNRPSESTGRVESSSKGKTAFGNINNILPGYICDDIKEAFTYFGEKISGFDNADTLLSAVESRTSSPVRILRDEGLESNIKGIFPCGEGAGYAGGITSSAIDGIKVFEEIYGRFCPE